MVVMKEGMKGVGVREEVAADRSRWSQMVCCGVEGTLRWTYSYMIVIRILVLSWSRLGLDTKLILVHFIYFNCPLQCLLFMSPVTLSCTVGLPLSWK